MLFKYLYYSTVVEDVHQLLLSRCNDRVFSYDAERKRLRRLGHILNNNIGVARLLFETSNYILPILVLLEVFNTPEDYVAVLKNNPFFKYGKSK